MYILHHAADFASSVVHFALEEMDLRFSLSIKDLDGGDLDTPAYGALNPLRLIPALEGPDGPIFETAAILLFLSDRHGKLAPAPQDPDRGAFLSWLLFTSNTLHPATMFLFYPHRAAGEAASDAARQVAHAQIVTRLGLINEMIAEKRPRWLSPDEPGVLGYYLGILVRWLSILPPDPFKVTADRLPALHAVLAAHETRPAALRVAEIDKLGATPFTNPKG